MEYQRQSADTTVDRLKLARSYIKAGWVKGTRSYTARFGDKVAYCAIGALDRAANDWYGCELVRRNLQEVLGVEFRTLPYLNDRVRTRKRHVLKAFDLAIAEAEAAEARAAAEARLSKLVHTNF